MDGASLQGWGLQPPQQGQHRALGAHGDPPQLTPGVVVPRRPMSWAATRVLGYVLLWLLPDGGGAGRARGVGAGNGLELSKQGAESQQR